jgi:hypothetical protein
MIHISQTPSFFVVFFDPFTTDPDRSWASASTADGVET